MLELALRHRFPGPAGFALDAAFTAPTPGVTAIFGPSGCGKSTLLAAVAGLLHPQHGRVVLDGVPLLDTDARHVLPPERRRCGVVFQDARLFPHLSVESNLRYGLRRAPLGGQDWRKWWRCWASAICCGGGRPRFRAGRSSAWHSAGRCCRALRCCSWTSRWRPSMAPARRRCCPSWRGCGTG
jgi:hypothetical protein